MAQNFKQDGLVVYYVVPAETTIAAGDVVVINSMVGVALTSGTAGNAISVQLEGVFELEKTNPLVINQGDEVFFNTTTKKVTKTATDVPLGVAFAGAISAATKVEVKLHPAAALGHAANVAAVSAADGSDLATTQTLANQLKTRLNSLLTNLKAAGLMVPD